MLLVSMWIRTHWSTILLVAITPQNCQLCTMATLCLQPYIYWLLPYIAFHHKGYLYNLATCVHDTVGE